MPKVTLVVMAAGIGSRFGGLKQIEPIGPSGETIIDYSIYDAIRAGFDKVVFIIRKDIEEAFKEAIGRRFEDKINVRYVFQELDKLPAGFSAPAGRKKPWGTGQAVLMAADEVGEPFAVINGDDFYGARSMQLLAEYLRSTGGAPGGVRECAMVGFLLRQTLSEHGHVARGVCQAGADGFLERIEERTKIVKDGVGARFTDESGADHPLTGDEVVSMNLWGFTPDIFNDLRDGFAEFLKANAQSEKAEFYLPSVVNSLIDKNQARVKVIPTPDSWFGVTYREDKPFVDKSIRALIEQGIYPARLWPAG